MAHGFKYLACPVFTALCISYHVYCRRSPHNSDVVHAHMYWPWLEFSGDLPGHDVLKALHSLAGREFRHRLRQPAGLPNRRLGQALRNSFPQHPDPTTPSLPFHHQPPPLNRSTACSQGTGPSWGTWFQVSGCPTPGRQAVARLFRPQAAFGRDFISAEARFPASFAATCPRTSTLRRPSTEGGSAGLVRTACPGKSARSRQVRCFGPRDF